MLDEEGASDWGGGDGSDVDYFVSYSSEHSSFSVALGDKGSDTGDPENHSE